MKLTRNLFEKMSALTHIFECWDHFRRGKRKRKDIQDFFIQKKFEADIST